MLLATGMWMFVLHTSLNITGTSDHYAIKTFFGLLETVTPHLFGMALLVFILTHCFAIIQEVKQEDFRKFSLIFFLLMLITNLSGFFITKQNIFFAFVKLTSTILFILFSLWAMFKLYRLR